MKKFKCLLSFFMALILTLSLCIVSFAQVNTRHSNINTQYTAYPVSIPCYKCGIGSIRSSIIPTKWVYTGQARTCIQQHTRFSIQTWERTLIVTSKCTYCSYGWTSAYKETKDRHMYAQ